MLFRQLAISNTYSTRAGVDVIKNFKFVTTDTNVVHLRQKCMTLTLVVGVRWFHITCVTTSMIMVETCTKLFHIPDSQGYIKVKFSLVSQVLSQILFCSCLNTIHLLIKL